MKLSILIPSLKSRHYFLESLLGGLQKQKGEIYNWYDVEFILDIDNGEKSIGNKRNLLLEKATGEYVCFVDDDDRMSGDYIYQLLEGIKKGVDCCSLKGIITENGINAHIFEHSIKYHEYKTNESVQSFGKPVNYNGQPVKYERYPNHLNCIKASIAKQFRFPEINHGEDTDWATQIHKSGLIKTEHYIPEILYYYDWRTK